MRSSHTFAFASPIALAIGLLFGTSPALAQETASSDPTQTTAHATDIAVVVQAATASTGMVAQASGDPDAADEAPAIVVTGSRIARPEADSPVPLAVLGQDRLLQDSAQNISDTLNELPQAGIGTTRTNTNFLTSGTGVATVNLRGLGTTRTLVLVNGRRHIGGFAGDSSVDLNNIPTDFIDRVEILTGGSSAVYGSDAIAGVVNFVLKDKYEGIGIRLQAGLTARGDNPTYLGSITAGVNLIDDRLHLIGNFTWDKDKGLASRDRSISDEDCGASFFNGEICGPHFFSTFASQGRFSLVDEDGAAQSVLPGGTDLFTFTENNSLQLGFPDGFGFNRDAVRLIATPIDRKLLTGLVNFEVTPDIKFFAEGTYSWVNADSDIEALAVGSGGSTAGVDFINIDNPFIPTTVANAITAANADANPDNNVAFINFRRRSNEIFDRSNTARRQTFRIATGFKGELAGKYDWEVSYVYGRMHDFNSSNDINIGNYNNALDAIRVGPGNVLGVDIVCRSAAARADGCIPMNLFGHDTVDPRAAAYVEAEVPRSEDIVNQQKVVTASISGPLLSLWAGDVTGAIGAEYHKEQTADTVDDLTRAGLNSGNQLTNLRGQYHVWEAFGELNVPLLRDMSFTKYLGLTGAARYSKYSTIGGVFSYNIGAEWEPVRDLRFRGMYAVANRAPNLVELFSQPSQTFAGVTDPCDGVTAATAGEVAVKCRAIPGVAAAIAADGTFDYSLADLQTIDGFIGGNRDLREETAKTKTIGAVFTPSFVPGLAMTVDYYDIKVKDAINTLDRDFTIEQCLLTGNPVFCGNVFRNANTGFITRVNGQQINVASLKNRGVDVSVNYTRRLNLMPDDRLTLALNYTYLIDNKIQSSPGDPVIQNAGTFGRGFSRSSAFVRGSYKFGIVTLGWTTNFLQGGDFFSDFESNDPELVKLNKVPDYWLHDAQVRFDPDKRFSLYFNVDNIFDTKPHLLPGAAFPTRPGGGFGSATGLETSPDFDVFGRRFTAGARVHF
jgi:iron complex outermembrane recepter protein